MELRRIARHRITISAATEMARQKVLHQLWAANTKNTRKINQIRREIEEDQLKMSSITTEKQDEIELYELEKRHLIHKNSMTLNRLMYVFLDLKFCIHKTLSKSDSSISFLYSKHNTVKSKRVIYWKNYSLSIEFQFSKKFLQYRIK